VPKKGISSFTLQSAFDSITSNSIVQQWLYNNGYKYVAEDGIQPYYYCYDAIMGKSGLRYTAYDNRVDIQFWIGGVNNPYILDDAFAGSMPKAHHKDLLGILQNTLLNGNVQPANQVAVPNQPQYVGQPTYSPQFNPSYTDNKMTGTEKAVVAFFIVSLFTLLLSVTGMAVAGGILIFLCFYFGIKGLKTRKRGLAIATIVLTSLSTVFSLLYLIIVFTSN